MSLLLSTASLDQDPTAAGGSQLRYSDDPQVRRYASAFADVMEMRGCAELVSDYLDDHGSWFRRCAAPMTVEAIGGQGYTLTLGTFGNFGFEVEPTIGLELLPQNQGLYRILTVPHPSGDPKLEGLYDVEFNASLQLDQANDAAVVSNDSRPQTLVRWELDLSVWVRLPGVITLLPDGLVQSSGDHLLRQIVRQVSRKLTWKVQEDFHSSQGLECPPRRQSQF